jgi:hypothetical protein
MPRFNSHSLQKVLPVCKPFKSSPLAEKTPAPFVQIPGTEGEVAGVISLRKDLPIWPTPKGIFLLVVRAIFLKFTNSPLRRFWPQISSFLASP